MGGSAGFTADPSANWVLETLELRPNARLNLTDRQGFEFHGPGVKETVYIKKVVLHPGAVLNTALQTLYYQSLVDENDTSIDPETLPDGTGRNIVDVPLLGFSLGIIAMNDDTDPPFNEIDNAGRL